MTKIGNVWVFIEQEGGKIADVSLELVCKGKELASKLGVKVEAVLLGNNVAHCADTLFSYGSRFFLMPRSSWILSRNTNPTSCSSAQR